MFRLPLFGDKVYILFCQIHFNLSRFDNHKSQLSSSGPGRVKGEGQVRVRKVKEPKYLDLRYTLFLVFTHPTHTNFFLA